jgi:hypothetical protein
VSKTGGSLSCDVMGVNDTNDNVFSFSSSFPHDALLVMHLYELHLLIHIILDHYW